MGVLKEWQCIAHGPFDGIEPHCPHGCKGEGMVLRAFRTAPALQSRGYRVMNNTFESLAREHGLSNMSNRLAIQDGTGMRRADYDTHRRINQANELIMHSSKAGMVGADAGSFFKPLNQFQPGSTGEGGAVRRVGDTVMVGETPLRAPTPRLEAAPHDGTQAGLPSGDA